ncbi:MAG: sugar-phosphatase [Cellulosilyticaceae bacterium]
MYKLIALDMDGTLLKSDHTISEETKHKLMQAKELGVKVVLASGRPIEGLQRYLEELDLQNEGDYVVSYNGAFVQDTYTKEVVSKITLKGQDLHELHELAQELKVNIHAFSKLGCITPILTKYSELEGEINGIDVTVLDYSTIEKEEDIIKIMMVEEPEILEEAIKKLPAEIYEKYTVVRSAPFFLEFLHKEVNKGAGVKALAEALNITREEVICVGDAGNDEHMVRFAGLGVAMGNAFPELKEIANFITKTNEEDGVAHVVDKFILKTVI